MTDRIHSYLRDHAKISDEDKTLFVAGMLLALRDEPFQRALDEHATEQAAELFTRALEDFPIDAGALEFLRRDKTGAHLRNIAHTVQEATEQCGDLLGRFYGDFVYHNGKSLGIVLTPPHIVQLMVDMLELAPDDVFLDLCAGTGSFVLEALRREPTLEVIAIEYQTKLHRLLKCSMMLGHRSEASRRVIKGDCFEYEFKATKSAINPPYGMRDRRELDFVIKQLESLSADGLAAAIVPCSCLSKSPARARLFELARVRKIVVCNENLFYPGAGVKTCILLLERRDTTPAQAYEVELVNYEKDGYMVKRGYGRIKKFDPLPESSVVVISEADETWLKMRLERSHDAASNAVALQMRLLDLDDHARRRRVMEAAASSAEASGAVPPRSGTSQFRISDLFTILKKPAVPYAVEEGAGLVAEVSARNSNNGVKGFVPATTATFTGGKIVLVTGGNGGAGLAFYQEDDFVISSATVALEPNVGSSLARNFDRYVGTYIALELSRYKEKYSRGFQWNRARITSDTINLPVDAAGEIDHAYMRACCGCVP